MNLSQVLQQSGVIDSMARELNIDPATAKMATGALLPAIVAGMGRSTTQAAPAGGGLGDILGSLAGASGAGGGLGGLGGILLDQVTRQDPTPTQPGNDILGQIFGSKDVSRGVASEVSAATGIDSALLKKMLPILAMAVAGYMAKQAGGGATSQQDSGLGGILGSIVGGLAGR
ncbi:MAG: hypothetical protein DI637_04425 [Citromicrobium sp.]|nr:MAG: hypothetical protein DI637_04425 [Citromicrobium sp.]